MSTLQIDRQESQTLLQFRNDVQKVRVRTSNRLFAINSGEDDAANVEDQVVGKIDENHDFHHYTVP